MTSWMVNGKGSSRTSAGFTSRSLALALAECDLAEYVIVDTVSILDLLVHFASSGLTVAAYQCSYRHYPTAGVEDAFLDSSAISETQRKVRGKSSSVFTLLSYGVGEAVRVRPRLKELVSSAFPDHKCSVSTRQAVASAVIRFSEVCADVLLIGRFLILKSLAKVPAGQILPLDFSHLNIEVFVSSGVPTTIPGGNSVMAVAELRKATNSVVVLRTELPLFEGFLSWLRDGRKATTIRFRRGAVELVGSTRIPIFETTDFSVEDRSKRAGYVNVSAARYRRFHDLSSDDAKRDGFEGIEEMRRSLKQIYAGIADEDWITVYDIQAGSAAL